LRNDFPAQGDGDEAEGGPASWDQGGREAHRHPGGADALEHQGGRGAGKRLPSLARAYGDTGLRPASPLPANCCAGSADGTATPGPGRATSSMLGAGAGYVPRAIAREMETAQFAKAARVQAEQLAAAATAGKGKNTARSDRLASPSQLLPVAVRPPASPPERGLP
jgi:hypothetical protein